MYSQHRRSLYLVAKRERLTSCVFHGTSTFLIVQKLLSQLTIQHFKLIANAPKIPRKIRSQRNDFAGPFQGGILWKSSYTLAEKRLNLRVDALSFLPPDCR